MERGAKVVNNPVKGLRAKLKDNALISHMRCTWDEFHLFRRKILTENLI
jgi:hypothetical protein